jgi:hypothetical protein
VTAPDEPTTSEPPLAPEAVTPVAPTDADPAPVQTEAETGQPGTASPVEPPAAEPSAGTATPAPPFSGGARSG